MQVYGQLKNAQLEVANGTGALGGTAGRGRVFYDRSNGTVKYYGESGWVTLATSSGGGGGGGGSLLWTNEGDNAALLAVENSLTVFKFDSALAQKLRTSIIVPQSYTAGSAATLYVSAYSPSASNAFLLQATAYLIRNGTDAITSVALSRASTNSSLTNSVANQLRRVAFDITDSTGKIGGTSISPGDLVIVALTRGADTDTDTVRVLASGSEAKFS